jgi:hypothetical protein
MNYLESSVWKLFKGYFVETNFVEKTTYVTLVGMRDVLKRLVERIERNIAQFEAD